MRDLAVIVAVLVTGWVLLRPRLAGSDLWRATITPLASIIGSGFLVLGPILGSNFGKFAPLVMLALCVLAAAFGSAVQFNIALLERGQRSTTEERLEVVASIALTLAYLISVTYYLNLFGAFGTSLTSFNSETEARILTSVVFLVILGVGWTRGFHSLENMEYGSVMIKLSMIGGLLIGLCLFFQERWRDDLLVFSPPSEVGLEGLMLVFGLIVTVQGFEISRYLGDEYEAETRIRSMRLAQAVSTVIYLVYISLVAYLFKSDRIPVSETAIIGMMEQVAPILPGLLVLAALSAQFSAAVADTNGAGGLILELSRQRVSSRQGYLAIGVLGLLLTWSANVFEIISYASRAFAAYYALQCCLAVLGARRLRRWGLALAYGVLALLGVAILLFGTPVE